MTKNRIIIFVIILLLLILAIFLLLQFDALKLTTSFMGVIKNPADIDNNGVIDDADKNQFMVLYQNQDLRADIDDNGKVDSIDASEYIMLWRENQ